MAFYLEFYADLLQNMSVCESGYVIIAMMVTCKSCACTKNKKKK